MVIFHLFSILLKNSILRQMKPKKEKYQPYTLQPIITTAIYSLILLEKEQISKKFQFTANQSIGLLEGETYKLQKYY